MLNGDEECCRCSTVTVTSQSDYLVHVNVAMPCCYRANHTRDQEIACGPESHAIMYAGDCM